MAKKKLSTKSMITLNKPNSLAAESYKMFRTNLRYMNVDRNNQVILFTSSAAEEGKTTTVCNAAVEFARDGQKTLLIECDLRKARIHTLMDIPQSPGLTNIIVEECGLHDVIKKVDGAENLDILTAGPLPPSPAELINSEKMVDLIMAAREEYDRVLIDAPPVLSVTDAAVISKLVDGVIIIAAAGETKKNILTQAKRHLDKVEANVLGVVLTKVDVKSSGYYYGYKSYYGSEGKGLFGRKKRRKDVDYMDDKMMSTKKSEEETGDTKKGKGVKNSEPVSEQ